jgi:tRNA(Ile)-lysidine synthase TilS/MesJ
MLSTPNIIAAGERRGLSLDQDIAALLSGPVNIALGVSGGKDSDALALRVVPFLREIGQQGEVILIHADLGAIEHADSLPQCQRLAERRIGAGMRYQKGWPTRQPTFEECATLASARREVAALYG